MNSQYIDGHRIDITKVHEEMEKDIAISLSGILCINCKHYQYISLRGACECMSPSNMQKSMVNGAILPRFDAWFLRDKEDYCGVSGKWFDAK